MSTVGSNDPLSSTKTSTSLGRTNEKDVQVELDQLRSDVASLRDTLKAYGSGKVGEMRERASAREAELKLQIRENPLQAVGIAAGIGFLVGAIWR